MYVYVKELVRFIVMKQSEISVFSCALLYLYPIQFKTNDKHPDKLVTIIEFHCLLSKHFELKQTETIFSRKQFNVETTSNTFSLLVLLLFFLFISIRNPSFICKHFKKNIFRSNFSETSTLR